MFSVFYTTTLCIILQQALAAGRINYEKKLREQLFLHRQDYEATRRPVEYRNQTLVTHLGLHILHLTEVNPQAGYILIYGWLQLSWNDNSFKWNKDNFGGITNLRIPSNLIWIPDITVYNHASAESAANFGQTLALLNNNGTILWVPPVTIKFKCSFHELQSFPFDEHLCYVKFGSWTFDGFTMDLQLTTNDSNDVLQDYKTDHHEWKLAAVGAIRSEKIYSCCPEPYPDITYHLQLKRESPFYMVTLLLPSIYIMIFILIGFWLPPMAGEKLTLSVFNMISLVILMLHLHFVLEGSFYHIPGIVLFLCLSLIFVVLSLILSMFTCNMTQTQQNSTRSNFLLRLLNGRLGWILCLPQIKECLESDLLTSNEAHDNMEIPEGDCEKNPIDDWITLATAIDRIFFLPYAIVL
uniref:Neurotransmitter-gated ion-channel ligand-binding domain-containing protein n=1 Tax=Strigamia maritima TaxID=126957 RepID=T1J5M5_STRMM